MSEHEPWWLDRHHLEERVARLRCQILINEGCDLSTGGFPGAAIEEELLDELAELELALTTVERHISGHYPAKGGNGKGNGR